MTITVGVLGAIGRMGTTVCDAVEADPDLVLTARVDPNGGEGFYASVAEMPEVDVVVDFTQPQFVRANIDACIARSIHCVVGTTGLSDDDLAAIESSLSGGKTNVFVAPNFSLGAVLMMHFAAQAARFFGSAEIVELHHNKKLDAPSGTSLKTARGISEAWKAHGRPSGGEANPDEEEVIKGARGADADGVTIHSVRLHGLVAHQEVWMGGPGESLLIRHDSIDRVSFMPGVVLACKKVGSMPGLTVGLEHLLNLD